ncbi:MAG: indole-3-glycerol phosphate synthase TrpC [Dehalococcoidia bacterium]
MTTRQSTLTTGTILDRIVAAKQEELGRRRTEEPTEALREKALRFGTPLPFASAITGTRLRLIAEIKKASPAKGILEPNLEPLTRALTYARGGAAAVSVLTEAPNFLGRLEYLETIRLGLDAASGSVGRPALLRKDFLFDPYHVYEAWAYGADALLLIVAILPDELLAQLLALADELGLGALVEVHDEGELDRALAAGARTLGINNRDLRTFHTTLAVTERLLPLVPRDRVDAIVSESGLHGADDATRMRALGVDAVLVGEALMTSDDVITKMGEFMPE